MYTVFLKCFLRIFVYFNLFFSQYTLVKALEVSFSILECAIEFGLVPGFRPSSVHHITGIHAPSKTADAFQIMMAASQEKATPAWKPLRGHAPSKTTRRGYQCVGCNMTTRVKDNWSAPLCNCRDRAWCDDKTKFAARCLESACEVVLEDEEHRASMYTDDDNCVRCTHCKHFV
jgi:hypothetical protein